MLKKSTKNLFLIALTCAVCLSSACSANADSSEQEDAAQTETAQTDDGSAQETEETQTQTETESQDDASALEFTAALENGINLGNSLDANNSTEYLDNPTIEEMETFWGNPVLSKELIASLADSGITTVRIPVSWAEHMDDAGTVDIAWMDRVQEVVDDALDSGLYVIIDTHHENWIVPTAEKEEEVKKTLVTLWQQIAERFADYDEHLLFEGLNEPRLKDTDQEWSTGTEEMQKVVNDLNAAFVETIRSSGGSNETRYLLIADYCNRYETAALEALEVPDDDRVIVSVHAYVPYDFTQNEDGYSDWSDDKGSEITTLATDLDRLFLSNGIPVIITEFGAIDKGNDADRAAWAEFFLTTMNEKGIPCLWWDDGSNYGVLNRNASGFSNTEIESLLTKSDS